MSSSSHAIYFTKFEHPIPEIWSIYWHECKLPCRVISVKLVTYRKCLPGVLILALSLVYIHVTLRTLILLYRIWTYYLRQTSTADKSTCPEAVKRRILFASKSLLAEPLRCKQTNNSTIKLFTAIVCLPKCPWFLKRVWEANWIRCLTYNNSSVIQFKDL